MWVRSTNRKDPERLHLAAPEYRFESGPGPHPGILSCWHPVMVSWCIQWHLGVDDKTTDNDNG